MGVSHLGLCRRLLFLGLPLWDVLTPQQRIALSDTTSDTSPTETGRHGLVVGTADRSLTTWRYYLAPIEDPALLTDTRGTLGLEVIASEFGMGQQRQGSGSQCCPAPAVNVLCGAGSWLHTQGTADRGRRGWRSDVGHVWDNSACGSPY